MPSVCFICARPTTRWPCNRERIHSATHPKMSGLHCAAYLPILPSSSALSAVCMGMLSLSNIDPVFRSRLRPCARACTPFNQRPGVLLPRQLPNLASDPTATNEGGATPPIAYYCNSTLRIPPPRLPNASAIRTRRARNVPAGVWSGVITATKLNHSVDRPISMMPGRFPAEDVAYPPATASCVAAWSVFACRLRTVSEGINQLDCPVGEGCVASTPCHSFVDAYSVFTVYSRSITSCSRAYTP